MNIPGVCLSFIPRVAKSLDEMNNRRSSVGADGRVAECQTSRSCWRRLPLAVAAWPPPPNAHNFFASTVSIPSSIPLFLSLAAGLVHQCKYPLGLDPHQHPPGCVQQIGAEFGSRLPSVPSRCRSDSRRLFTAARVTPTRARFSPRHPPRALSSSPPIPPWLESILSAHQNQRRGSGHHWKQVFVPPRCALAKLGHLRGKPERAFLGWNELTSVLFLIFSGKRRAQTCGWRETYPAGVCLHLTLPSLPIFLKQITNE